MWLLDFVSNGAETLLDWGYVIGVAIVIYQAVSIYYILKRERHKKKWDSVGKDVVVLHTLGRGYTCPHMSPFGLKLETYLKMAGFKIQIDEDYPMSHKGKTPWITFNGVDLSDSQLIIEHLSSTYKDVDSHLTDTERAVAWAFQVLVDEHLYWGLVRWRYMTDTDFRAGELSPIYPSWLKYIRPVMKYFIGKELNAQGLGRHTDAEVLSIMRKDLESVSTYLGEKPFLMGDQPSTVDCSVFGELSQCVWNAPDSPYYAMVTVDFPNLQKYCIRMKEKFWPDWEEVLTKPTK